MTDAILNRRRLLAGTAAALSAPVAILPALNGTGDHSGLQEQELRALLGDAPA